MTKKYLFFLIILLSLDPIFAQEIVIDKGPECDDPSIELSIQFEGETVNKLEWEEWRTHKGKHYYKSIQKVSFQDAKRIASNLNGYLATCNNEVINHEIRQILPTEHWIGFVQDVNAPDYNEPMSAAGGFYWMSGADRGFVAWASSIGEPNNYENNNPGKYTVQGCYPENLDLWCDEGEDKLAFALIESDDVFTKPKPRKVKKIQWSTGDTTVYTRVFDERIKKVKAEILFDDGETIIREIELDFYRLEVPKDTVIFYKDIRFNQAILLEAQNKGNYYYEWSPKIGLDSYINEKVNHQFKKDIIYTLKVRSKQGCEAEEIVNLKGLEVSDFLEELLIPETFTPNGDGVNDEFYVEILDFIEDFKLQIFEISGMVIFETTDPTIRWDGTHKNKPLNTGVYGIVIRYTVNGQVKEFTRPLVIQR